jgi:hypothetical protein
MVVLIDGNRVEDWTLTRTTIQGQGYRLMLEAVDGRSWTALARDLFASLLELRRKLEPLGIQLCCNGARRDAWPTGMMRDMGGGFAVCLHDGVAEGARAPEVRTLAYAPPDEVVSVEDQNAWCEAWWRQVEGTTAP